MAVLLLLLVNQTEIQKSSTLKGLKLSSSSRSCPFQLLCCSSLRDRLYTDKLTNRQTDWLLKSSRACAWGLITWLI